MSNKYIDKPINKETVVDFFSILLAAIAVFCLLFYMAQVVFGSSDNEDEVMPVLYAMSDEVKNVGVITYNFNTNNEKIKSAFYTAFDEWTPFIQGIEFIEDFQNPNSARIQIFEDQEQIEYHGYGSKANEAETSLIVTDDNEQGIVGAEIVFHTKGKEIKEKYVFILNLAKHELGHALGLGHSDNYASLMYEGVDMDQEQSIDTCSAEAVEISISQTFIGDYECN